jgi:hypothetical protein
MSIISVGASFGYIVPASVAGPVQSSQPQAETEDTPPAPAKTQSDTPPPAPPSTTSDTPKFAPATGATLIQIQEKASAA